MNIKKKIENRKSENETDSEVKNSRMKITRKSLSAQKGKLFFLSILSHSFKNGVFKMLSLECLSYSQ